MKGKKAGYLLILGFFLMSIIPLISAASFGYGSFDIRQGPSDVINLIKDFTSPFFEALLNTSAYSEFFFAKCLLFILVFIAIYFVLKKIDFLDLGNKKGILLIISGVVSILGLRYLPENDFIKGVLLPYNALGLAIAIFIPFLIFFFFVEKSVPSPPGRRFAWIIYAVIFGVLWANRYDEISQIANYIYLAGLIFVILALIFDSTLHKYFRLEDLRKHERSLATANKIDLLNKLEKAQQAQARNPKDKDVEEYVKNLRKALKMNAEESGDFEI